MARPLPLDLPVHDSRVELEARLRSAPVEHAEALLAACELLQTLHDRGTLDLARGAVSSGDKLVEIVVAAARSPESIRGLRNLLLLINMLGAIDPDVLKAFTQAVPEALRRTALHPEPVGLWTLLRDFFRNQDFRHGLSAVNTLLESFGRSLSESRDAASKGPATPSVTR